MKRKAFEASELQQGEQSQAHASEVASEEPYRWYSTENLAELVSFVQKTWNRDRELKAYFAQPGARSYALAFQEMELDTFSLNPEMAGIAPERAQIDLPPLAHLQSDWLWDVFQEVVERYNETHVLPGVEYAHWLTEHGQELEQFRSLPEGRYFLPGSLLANTMGNGTVPYINVKVGEEASLKFLLLKNSFEWDHGDRVLLLRRSAKVVA